MVETFLSATADVLDTTSACWHHTDPASGLPISGAVLGDPPGSLEEALEYEFRRPDVNRFRDLSARRTPVAAISAQTRGELDSSPRFREMIEPTGTADELRVAFRDAFGIWAAVVIFTGRRMTAEDLRFVADVMPSATCALRVATAAQLLDAGASVTEPCRCDPDGGGPAVLILDAHDQIVAADATARRRLALLPEDRDVPVPGVIAFVAAQARWGTGDPATARMRTLDGRWFVVDASRLDGAPGGQVAVVIQPASSAAVLDGVLRAFGLSAREREVVSLVLEGRSTKAIASELVLSPWTVQDHLKAVYEKTGVRNRSDLAGLVPSHASD